MNKKNAMNKIYGVGHTNASVITATIDVYIVNADLFHANDVFINELKI